MNGARYIRVILPLMHLDWLPTYSVPEGTACPHIGQRVNVRFCGRSQMGVVMDFIDTPDVEISKILPIESIAEGLPDISKEEIDFWKFISDYYLCPLGEVFKAAYPMLKVNSEKVSAARKSKEASSGKNKEKEDPAGLPAAQATGTSTGLVGQVEVLTGDGRYEEYITRTLEVLEGGRNVLVLMPEISIGEKLEQDFRDKFGDSLLMYNSRQTAAARRRTAERLRDGSFPNVILGTRSALFLPFKKLGLIIVDEEQDPTYKQAEPAPRYNSRDAAVMLGQIHGAKVVLGSASPSFETEANILRGKYIEKKCRTNHIDTSIINVSDEKRKRGMAGRISVKLLEEMRLATTLPESTVLLIRGWEKVEEIAVTLEAEGYSCDDNGVYHKGSQNLMILTPSEARLIRSDITAVLQADALFSKSDFRADERALQTLVALRGWTSRFIIQTAKSSHPVFSFETRPLLKERKDFNLPPFSKLIDIILRDNNEPRLKKLSYELQQILSEMDVCFMPITAEGQIKGRINLGTKNTAARKAAIKETVLKFEKERKYQGHIFIDVDPV